MGGRKRLAALSRWMATMPIVECSMAGVETIVTEKDSPKAGVCNPGHSHTPDWQHGDFPS